MLANEQVTEGKCWRCDYACRRSATWTQWYFKITDYAQELLDDLDQAGRLARARASRCRRTGSAAPRAPRLTSRCATRDGQPIEDDARQDHRVHHARRHAVRLLASSCWRPSTRGCTDLVAGTEYEDDVREVVEGAEKVSGRRARPGRPREARRVHGPLHDQPRQRREGARMGGRLRGEQTTAPARSWPCRAATSATSSSPASTTCPSSPSSCGEDDPLYPQLKDEQRVAW